MLLRNFFNRNITIFAGGSEISNAVSIAYCYYRENVLIDTRKSRLHRKSSVCQTDLLAIEEGMQWFKNYFYDSAIKFKMAAKLGPFREDTLYIQFFPKSQWKRKHKK